MRTHFAAMIAAVFALVCVPVEAGKLPLRKNASFGPVRAKLLATGWKPLETYEQAYDNTYQHRLGWVGEIYRAGFPEIAHCSGAGVAFCEYFYRRRGECLKIVTRGEADPPDQKVDNWSRQCPDEITRPAILYACRNSAERTGACFSLKGTVSLVDDDFVLTRDGDRKQLRLTLGDWPRELDREMDLAQARTKRVDAWVHGQFEVCPIERKNGGQRFTCIETAHKLTSGPPETNPVRGQ